MTRRKRYALVGTGSRSAMYTTALATTYADGSELVGLCDVNRTRMARTVARMGELSRDTKGHAEPACCEPAEFAAMLKEQQVDEVIVTSIDRTHHRYIIEAMEAGCDVICEKPLTVDANKCKAVLEAERRTRAKPPGYVQLPLRPPQCGIRSIVAGRCGRPTDVGPFRVAPRHRSWGGLFSPLAPGQTELRWSYGP